MEEIEDSLSALLSEFNARTGRKIVLCPSTIVPQDPAYIVFTMRDLSTAEDRLLSLCILDVVEPWGSVGLPEAAAEINEAVENFWCEGSREPNSTVYIPPKHDTADGFRFTDGPVLPGAGNRFR